MFLATVKGAYTLHFLLRQFKIKLHNKDMFQEIFGKMTQADGIILP